MLYPSIRTRPDIALTTDYLLEHIPNPTVKNWNHDKHMMRYLPVTLGLGNIYERKGNEITIGYSYSDWGQIKLDRKSIVASLFILAGGAVWLPQQGTRCSHSKHR